MRPYGTFPESWKIGAVRTSSSPSGRGRAAGQATVSEPECKRLLRSLGIASATEWARARRTAPRAMRRLHLPEHPEKAYRNRAFWKEYEGRYPHLWNEFHLGRTRSGSEQAKAELAQWARFAARYRVATAYRGLRFSGVGAAVTRGYSAALGVFLAYSALESCLKAGGPQPGQKMPGRIDLPLADRLRAALGGSLGAEEELSNERLRVQLGRFFSGEDDDVMVPARAIRHLVAHGVLTASGGRILTSRSALAFQDLADAILDQAAWLFRAKTLVEAQTRN